MLASAAGHADVVSLLLERGARTHLRDAEGNTAEKLARAAGREELAARLAASGSGPSLKDLF
jgi:ankyrin repeat protein